MSRPAPDARREPRVFTISPGLPFLPTFIDALMGGTLLRGFPDAADRLSLSAATIFLPTRRAARALTALLAERSGGECRLLPRIVPLGDVDDAEIGLRDADFAAGLDGGLPPAIGETERRLVLTRLVLAFAQSVDRGDLGVRPGEPLLIPASPADAFVLAGDLGRLMDQLTTEDISWDALAGVVEERYDRYFAITLEFLKIAAEAWPAVLAARGVIDPVRRRNLVIDAEVARLTRERPLAPMVAAGSTGSISSTARLLAAIGRLPNGAVVLPGLDKDLDGTSWDAIAQGGPDGEPAHGHPQAALHRLLSAMGIGRDAVTSLGEPSPAATRRTHFLREALRPAVTTERWAPSPLPSDGDRWAFAFDDLAVVKAADEREEALAASLVVREALETPGATAALITPDRGLAERVGAELRRWDIDVDDSAGMPLTRTLPGRLAQLAVTAAVSGHAARELVALLAHPYVTLGWPRVAVERAAAALEIGLLRGPAPPAGLRGLKAILPQRRAEAGGRHAGRPVRRLTEDDWHSVAALIERLVEAFAGLSFAGSEVSDFLDVAARHRDAILALARPADGERDRLFAGEAGEALDALFDDLALCDGGGVEGRFADYPPFFAALAAEHPVRPRRARHRRVKIWGLLEARLLDVDHVVVGGLDEGVWPPVARTDAFLNRPMRAALGLLPPERRIGQTAHDFVAALGARRAVITRAMKREGAPTVPSRFLQRMEALAGPRAWQAAVAAGARYLALGALLERPQSVPLLRRPAPKPPADLLPRALSVTEIETLVRDPYSIFAKHVLKLDALDDLAVAPGAADRGTIVHDVLGRFAAEHPRALPPDALDLILSSGERAFALLGAYPDIAAQWWPRFARLAEAFVRWERLRRPGLACVHAEISGAVPLAVGPGQVFTLRARADRIEEHRDGARTIVDFKTGTPPSAKTVFAGFAPQLTLEAAMLARNAFKDVAADGAMPALLYLHATGGARPLEPCPIVPPSGEARTIGMIVAEHFAKLERLIGRYLDGEIGFMARPYPQYARRFNEYDHLARTKEWSLAADADTGEGA